MNSQPEQVDLRAEQQVLQEDLQRIYNSRNDPGMLALRRQLALRLEDLNRKLRSCDPVELGRVQGQCIAIDDTLQQLMSPPINGI